LDVETRDQRVTGNTATAPKNASFPAAKALGEGTSLVSFFEVETITGKIGRDTVNYSSR
jgi:hypothetical protein